MKQKRKSLFNEGEFANHGLAGGWSCLFMIVVLIALGQLVKGQDFKPSVAAVQLPTATEVIDRYIAKMGGYEQLESRKSVHITYDATKNDEPFEYEIFIAPGQYYSSSRYETGRWFERGINDGVAWTRIDGVARQLEGEELRGILSRHRIVCPATHWEKRSKSIKLLGIKSVARRPAYCLRFTDQIGSETFRYFDCESCLLLRSESTEIHGGHRTRVQRDYSDYQQVGESLVPLNRRIVAGSKTYQYTVKSFDVDVRIPVGTFDLPPNVKRSFPGDHR